MTPEWFSTDGEHMRTAMDLTGVRLVTLERNSQGRWLVGAFMAPGQGFILANTLSRRDAETIYERLCRTLGIPVEQMASSLVS